jgi:hypothetical protein
MCHLACSEVHLNTPSSDRPSTPSERSLAVLSDDAEPTVREAGVRGLQRRLERLVGLSRTELVARWASSHRARRRVAIAGALRSDTLVLGATTVLDCLARDEMPAVRAAAYASAAFRLEAGSVELSDILWRGAVDRDDAVREVAVVGLQRLAIHGVDPVRSRARRTLAAL